MGRVRMVANSDTIAVWRCRGSAKAKTQIGDGMPVAASYANKTGLEVAISRIRVHDSISVPDVAALQIDLDARRFEQDFYAAVQRDLRRRFQPDLEDGQWTPQELRCGPNLASEPRMCSNSQSFRKFMTSSVSAGEPAL